MDQVEQPHELKWRERKGVPKKGKAGGGKEKEEKGTGKKKRKEEEKGRIEFRRGGKETGSSTAGVEGEPRSPTSQRSREERPQGSSIGFSSAGSCLKQRHEPSGRASQRWRALNQPGTAVSLRT